jgi:glycosyltransferase involved in cell wall biosynthesis
MRRQKIYIESRALVADHFSGVGHYVLGVLKALDEYISLPEHTELQLENQLKYESFLCIPRDHRLRLKKLRLLNFGIKLFLHHSWSIDRLLSRNLFPPLDLIFGRGVYLFTNFSSYPLLWSKSATIIYDITFEAVPQFVDANNRRFLSKMVKRTAQKSDLIITISAHTKKELVNFYKLPPEKIVIAYPGVDLGTYYRRSDKEIKAVKYRYGLPDDYVLFVGNIEPRKNIGGLIDAYSQLPLELCKKHPLVLVGASGWLTEEIFDKIDSAQKKGYPIVRPKGYVADEDMPAVYSAARALVFPSHYEGFGIPPVEAMACRVPVISADNSSLPEAVGDAALMVKSSDTKSIADAIERLLTNKSLQRELVAKGYEQAKKFSWSDSAQIIYKSLVEL